MSVTEVEAAGSGLVDRARGGDEAAITELWRLHHSRLVGYARRVTRSVVSAEDLASEAWLGMMCALRSGHGPSCDEAVGGYLATVVRHAGERDGRRWGSRVTPVASDEVELVAPPVPAVDGFVDVEAVRSLMAGLPAATRELLVMAVVEELPQKVIAERLGKPLNATKLAIRHAKEQLKVALLAQSLAELGPPGSVECTWVRGKLPAYARGGGRAGVRAQVDEHRGVASSVIGLRVMRRR